MELKVEKVFITEHCQLINVKIDRHKHSYNVTGQMAAMDIKPMLRKTRGQEKYSQTPTDYILITGGKGTFTMQISDRRYLNCMIKQYDQQ